MISNQQLLEADHLGRLLLRPPAHHAACVTFSGCRPVGNRAYNPGRRSSWDAGERWYGAFRPGWLWRICDSGFRRASRSAEAPSGPEWRLAWPGAVTASRVHLRIPDAGVGHEFRDPAVAPSRGFRQNRRRDPSAALKRPAGRDTGVTGGMGLDMIQEPSALAGCRDAGQWA